MNNRLRDIPKSRALTTGVKFWLALAFFALVGAFISGFITELQDCRMIPGQEKYQWAWPPINCDPGVVDAFLGPISLGWKGGVGNHFVYTVFVTTAAIALVMASLQAAYRDADPKSVAEAARTATPPVLNPPTHLNFWPGLAIFSLATLLIGLVVNSATAVAGAVAIGVSIIMWTMRDWADRATGDPDANEEIHERISVTLELPLAAIIIIGIFAVSASRIFLAVSVTAAVVIAMVAASIVFIVVTIVAYKPSMSRNFVTAMIMAAVISAIGIGVVSTAQGEREFHELDLDRLEQQEYSPFASNEPSENADTIGAEDKDKGGHN